MGAAAACRPEVSLAAPLGLSVSQFTPAELRGAGRVCRVPVGRERAFAGGFQEGSGCDRLIGAASARATAVLAGVDAPPRMRTDRERDDILRLWTPPTAGVNVLRLSFVLSRSSVAPRSYQPALLLGPFRPPFRVSWLGSWGDAGLPFLGGPVSASRVSGHLATLYLVTSSVSRCVPQVLHHLFFSHLRRVCQVRSCYSCQ